MANVSQVVPLFGVTDIDASLRFYLDGLGFELKNSWKPEGRIRWCWLELGGAALMLQEYWPASRVPEGKLGNGMSLNFVCNDALAIYRDLRAKGLDAKRPFVGNNMWVTGIADPDGYDLFFESPTDAPEESVYEDA